MRTVTLYSLSGLSERTGRTQLMRGGHATGPEIEGLLLEQQFELNDGSHLLWLTDDSPYDECLHIYLLGADGAVVDSIEAGAAFTPGILRIKRFAETWVDFEFFQNGTVYRLEVDHEARRRLLLPEGWRYNRRLHKHKLSIHKRAVSEADQAEEQANAR